MTLHVSYMGTKRQIASSVAEVVSEVPEGPVLDLFSGICAVSSKIGFERNIWCNDIQYFCSTVAAAFFTSVEGPMRSIDLAESSLPYYERNKKVLFKRFGRYIEAEDAAYGTNDHRRIRDMEESIPNCSTSKRLDEERYKLNVEKRSFPYRLFSITFSGSYFTLKQCIDIDSIRYALDCLLQVRAVDVEQRRWALLALCQAIGKVSNTTGHFAQYIHVKESNLARVLAKRRRSVWVEWLTAMDEIEPLGSASWRRKNKHFRNDAIAILTSMKRNRNYPAVVYADPPYTADHYSRYYHVYETLLLYDYPSAIGKGRYRDDRFVSEFCIKQRLAEALDRLVTGSAGLGSHLVLSYPDCGLLPESRESILAILRRHYSMAKIAREVAHFHSSLGASKGVEKYAVTEVIYTAC